jgi:hypothetical protein
LGELIQADAVRDGWERSNDHIDPFREGAFRKSLQPNVRSAGIIGDFDRDAPALLKALQLIPEFFRDRIRNPHLDFG